MKAELRRLANRLTRGEPRRVDWEGVYPTMADVPVHGPGFASDVWIETTRALTRQARDAARTSFVPRDARGDIALLASNVAQRRAARILDFGGGMGIGYIQLRHALATSIELDYHVVEGARVCDEGRALVPEVTFHTALPAGSFDIVYACSSLQYIDDHRALLASFAAYDAPFILLGDVPAGDVPTFWTAQLTVTGSRIAYKFFSVRELVDAMAGVGYPLLVRAGNERRLSVDTLPDDHRVPHTCNLLFGR